MTELRAIGLALVFIGLCNAHAQDVGIVSMPDNGFAFPDDELPTIQIECGEALGWMLAQENWYSNVEHPATFIFHSSSVTDTIENVGFRLRGNTSRAAPKKSFKISFNTFDEAQSWNGLEKMNLNGEHNDPSLMRARLSWECMRDAGVPVSRSQHVRLFINGTDYGVYSNTEHIDGKWLEKRFEHAHGNLWKCTYPANLNFVSNNPDAYKFTPSWSDQRVYELKTNKIEDDYSALAEFIQVLNNTALPDLPCALEDVFDVDAYLKAASGEILFGHWDNYIGNQNNFYLYQRSTDGRIMYIPYDMDNTLGIQWFGEWTDQNPYTWTTETNRPLFTRLLQVPAYRERFTWYLDWWMNTWFTAEWVDGRGAWLTDLMTEAVALDAFYPLSYGFQWSDFESALNDAWGSHVAHSISDYVESRLFWADVQLEPVGDNLPIASCWAEGPLLDDSLRIRCFAPEHFDASMWSFEASYSTAGGSNTAALLPSGADAHGYGWSITLPLNGNSFTEWQVAITDPAGNLRLSPCSPRRVWNSMSDTPIVINEVMPVNHDFHANEAGEFGDWVELLNVGDAPINTNNLFISNRLLEPQRWRLPNVTLDPGQHLLIWCDEDVALGPLHASFNLNGSNDELFVMRQELDAWRIVDYVTWENAAPNASWGRETDGAEAWTWFHLNANSPPTPNAPNGVTTALPQLAIEPVWHPETPCRRPCAIELPSPSLWTVFSSNGQVLSHGTGQAITLGEFLPGLHILQWTDLAGTQNQKIILE